MHPLSPRSIDIVLDPGRPARISLDLAGGIRLSGIQVWRTPRGPRVLFPDAHRQGTHALIAMPSSLRRDWGEAILAAWRRTVRVATESVASSHRRRAA